MELAGQEAGIKTGGAALVKPSTVTLAVAMAVWVAFVSLDEITTEKETESVVTCSKRRPEFNTTMEAVGGLAGCGVLDLNPNGTRLL
jgi:hypothetical protein